MKKLRVLAKGSYLILVLLLSLGQFSALTRSIDGRLYVFDLFVILFAFAGLGFVALFLRKILVPRQLLFFLLFGFVAFVSLVHVFPVLGEDAQLAAAYYLVRFISYTLAALVIFNLYKAQLLDKRFMQNVIIASGVLIALLGFAQLAILPDFTTLDTSLGWDPHKNRLASTFFDPNFTGCYLFLCLVLIFSRFGRLKSLDVAAMLVLLVALFLTFSRSSWGAGSVMMLVYGLFKYPRLLVVAALAVVLTYFAVPRFQTRLSGITDPSDSAYFRLISWQKGWELSKDNLLLGVGFNTLRYAQLERGYVSAQDFGGNSGGGVDSSFLFVLATTGALGLVFFSLAYFYPLYFAMANGGYNKLALSSVTFGLLLQSQFINALFYPQILFVWLMLLSCLLRTEQ